MPSKGFVFIIFHAIGMFIFGDLAARVYNIILAVGGGIDFNFKERSS